MNLHESAKNGNEKELKSRIDELFSEIVDLAGRKATLGRHDSHQLTPLHYAVKYNNIDVVRILLEKGADINVSGKGNTTPLHYATRYMKENDDCSLLQLLIYSEANANAVDDSGSTPLHYACLKGNEKAVRELLKVKDIDVKAQDKLNTQPIHHACAFGSLDILDLLSEKGANILAENEAKMTPIHVAVSTGHTKLIEHSFDLVQQQHGISAIPRIIEQQNIEGQALLHLAVLSSHLQVVKLLLERGCDVNQLMDDGETVLHIAAVTGHVEIVKLLLAHGCEVDKKNDMGRTASHKASRFGKNKIVDMLIKQNADINMRDDLQLTPLILASSSSSNSRTIKYLLENGANIELCDKEDRTALHMAVQDNNEKGVHTLLKFADLDKIINTKDKDSNTPLHIACANGYEEIAIRLLDVDADVQSRNNDGKTPLHLAAFYGQDDVVDNILEKNASAINDFDTEGNAALHLAALKGHHDVIEYLLKCGAVVNDKNAEAMTPLDCAATSGHTEAVKILIWGGASVQSASESGSTPLHLSCIEGHVETTEELLKHCEVGMTDNNGRNALDLAIDNRNDDAAIAILNHRDWHTAMRNRTLEDGRVTTPLRKMIARMPDVAMHCLNRCIAEEEEFPNDDEKYSLTLKYEFMDDVYSNWPCDIVRNDTEEGKGKGELYTIEKIEKELEKKESHVFSYMVEHQRQELLSHPLTLSMINMKWMKFAFYVYYFKLLLYVCFLFFVTGYIMVSAPLREPYRATDCTIDVKNATLEMKIFVVFGKYVVFLLALIHLLFELMQMVSQRLDYFAIDNLLEWTVYLLAIANVIDDLIDLPLEEAGLVCGSYQKSAGAICVFLAWVNFILFIRKVPMFGIYIVMFLYVISTFFKFFVVFIFLIMAFGFSFYVLLHDEKSIPSFDSPIGSLIKTGAMMTGEMNFDDFFFGDHKPSIVTWILFILFILLMVIVLMNLLVGLAVDDIQEVQKQAEMTKATMQIDLCLDSEKIFPKMLRQKFIAREQTVYPNTDKMLPSNINAEIIAHLRDIVKTEKEPIDELQDSLKGLQQKMGSLGTKVEDMEDQLQHTINELKTMMGQVLEHQQRRRKGRPAKPTDDKPGEADTEDVDEIAT